MNSGSLNPSLKLKSELTSGVGVQLQKLTPDMHSGAGGMGRIPYAVVTCFLKVHFAILQFSVQFMQKRTFLTKKSKISEKGKFFQEKRPRMVRGPELTSTTSGRRVPYTLHASRPCAQVGS